MKKTHVNYLICTTQQENYEKTNTDYINNDLTAYSLRP